MKQARNPDLRKWAVIGAVLCALAVMAGAFGAHALRDIVSGRALEIYEKGVFYHLIHALAILAVTGLAAPGLLSARAHRTVCTLLLAGIVLFSGSLYALSTGSPRWVGAVTPFGGLSFIAAWIIAAAAAFRAGSD